MSTVTTQVQFWGTYSISFLCLLHLNQEDNIALFTQLHLFDCFSYYFVAVEIKVHKCEMSAVVESNSVLK